MEQSPRQKNFHVDISTSGCPLFIRFEKYSIYHKVRVNNKLIIGILNINSIAGKFNQLKQMVQHIVDISSEGNKNRLQFFKSTSPH